MTRTVLTVVGARPQFVKAAALSRAIAGRGDQADGVQLREIIVHTGQHYDQQMSQSFFDELGIPAPAVNLEVGSGPHGRQTGLMLGKLEEVMVREKPDWVLVYGDTNSTLAGALAASKLHIPIAHVEAGLRSFNRRMPEEINRVLTDAIASALFAPSEHARKLLAEEGIRKNVFVEGDVMFDAVLHYRDRAIEPSEATPFALATIHRAENTDDPGRLKAILGALSDCPIPVILPLHPRTRKCMESAGVKVGSRVRILEPLSYFALLGYLGKCSFVLTDSGGLQKEAYFLGKRCIIVREETEWVELVECGANRLAGANADAIRAAFEWGMTPLDSGASQVYGRGDAAIRIVRRLVELMRG